MTNVYFTQSKKNIQLFKTLSCGDYFFFKDDNRMWLKTDITQAICLEGALFGDDLDDDLEVTPIKTVEIIYEL